jgi:hypothetical protein
LLSSDDGFHTKDEISADEEREAGESSKKTLLGSFHHTVSDTGSILESLGEDSDFIGQRNGFRIKESLPG